MAAVTATAASIDDLFRSNSLNQIHATLKETRGQVEAKKRELRELVGDHYRSVLESSDHIRSMFECAAKISAGSDRVEELIASMQTLAANPPPMGASIVAPKVVVSAPATEQDREYEVGLRIVALLEVPETMREHLSQRQFVCAARAVLVDAAALQTEVDALMPRGVTPVATSTNDRRGSFDFSALARQQTSTFHGLPQQVAASCVDAFSIASLEPVPAAESFAMRLLLDPAAQPGPLLQMFLERRRELLRALLDGGSLGSLSGGSGNANCRGARLAAAAMAYEGSVVLSSMICGSGAAGRATSPLLDALSAAFAGVAAARSAAEERAAIEGRAVDDSSGVPAAMRRAQDLAASLLPGSAGSEALRAALADAGIALAREWAPPATTPEGDDAPPSRRTRSLSARFARILSPASHSGGAPMTCAALGEVLDLGSEKLLSYRRALIGGSPELWPATWAAACKQFCPGHPPLEDALEMLTSNVEAACAEAVKERVGELQLELVPPAEEEGDVLESSAQARQGESAASLFMGQSGSKRREEIGELRRQSSLRILRFDEQLGEILADLAKVGRWSHPPPAVAAALLLTLRGRLLAACDAVHLPAAELPLKGSSQALHLWPLQRRAARAAVALDALAAAALGEDSHGSKVATHLRGALQAASSSGDEAVAAQARELGDYLRVRGEAAYGAWARLAVLPPDRATPLEGFWRLADDEVGPMCGWGSAKFGAKGGEEGARAVPVPVQASPFVSERLLLGAQRAFEVNGGDATGGAPTMPRSLVAALKTALAESFAAAYAEAVPEDLTKLQRSGMAHLLQWLFDLRFLRIALSSEPTAGPGGAPSGGVSGAYDNLCSLLDRAEAAALNDPVDRLLYQEVLRYSVKGYIEGVKMLLLPLFQHNPLHGFLSSGRDEGPGAGGDHQGFELQAVFAPPLRPTLNRFPLLPVAMTSALSHASASDLDARLGFSDVTGNRGGDSGTGPAGAAMPSITGALGALGLGGGWTSGLGGKSWGFGASAGGGAGRPPQAV